MRHLQKKSCQPPVPREGVYELYWGFASRRQAAFEARLSGKLEPWSRDAILQKFKFCNVFRAADRVSQYMIRTVIYGQKEGSVSDRLFRIVAFRTFSNIDTWEKLTEQLGHAPSLDDLSSGRFLAELDEIKKEKGGLYTGAFILCATKAYGHSAKHHNHSALFADMFLRNCVGERIANSVSLSEIVSVLQSFPLMGPFMSYQTAIDINYSELVDFSENDFTQAGPGAMRGLKKVFLSLGGYTAEDTIKMMVDRQEEEFERFNLPFDGLWGRPLHAIDCQGLFCETDKYCRVAVPDLESNRIRIKAKFSPSSDRIDYFFPPKWGIKLPELGSSLVGSQAQLFERRTIG